MNQPLPILILPLGTAPEVIAEARFAGYLPVLTDQPDGVRVVLQEQSVDRHHMLMAAMHGLNQPVSDQNRVAFFNELHRRIKDGK